MQTHGYSPIYDQVSVEWHDRILHARLNWGDAVLMGSDAPADHLPQPQGIYVALGVGDTADAERIFKALAENGTVQMPLEETFWAARFGMLIDRFGTPWMVNCERAA